MQRSPCTITSNRWVLLAAVGLGFCFASTEYERYTALWIFETRSLGELVLIISMLIAVLAAIAYRSFGGARRFYRSRVLLGTLVFLQTVGLFGRTLQTMGYELPPWFTMLTSVAMQSAGLLFLLYAELFLEVGVKKTIRSFAFGVMIAGALQVLIMGFDALPAIAILFFFMPVSAVLLVNADRLRSDAFRENEQEDVGAELGDDESFSKDFPFWEYCVSIALLTVLLLALHNQGMMLQDSGEASRMIQVSAGLGGMIAGLIILSTLNYLQESDILELFRLLVLPLLLVALYVSALFGGSGVVVYLILLGICYAIVLLFVWTVPRYYRTWGSPFVFTCVAYFSYRLGWALGIFGIMIAPVRHGSPVETSVILTAFCVLLILSAMRLIRNRRLNAERLQVAKEAGELRANTDIAFSDACKRVADRFHLTPREGEVLVLLARGRNAQHIAEALVISDGTARTHIMHIYQKMEVSSQQVLMDCVDEELNRSLS